MAVKTNAELAAFFNTGDQPSEAEFGHLIDTIQPPHVQLATNANTSLTVASHAFRTLIMGNISTGVELQLPAAAADVWFHIVYLPLAADAHTLVIKTGTLNSHFFEGSIIHSETDDAGVGNDDIVAGNGSSNDHINIISAKHADIWIHGKNTTNSYVYGHVVGDDNTQIADS